MSAESEQLILRIDIGGHLDPEERVEFGTRLREELIELNTVLVAPAHLEKIPAGSKGVPADWASLTVSLAPAVLTAVVSTIKIWVDRHSKSTVVVSSDNDKIEVTGNPSREEQRLIDAFVERLKTK